MFLAFDSSPFNPLIHWGFALLTSLVGRPLAQKFLKFKKIQPKKQIFSQKIISAVKLSSGVSSQKLHFIQVIHGSLAQV